VSAAVRAEWDDTAVADLIARKIRAITSPDFSPILGDIGEVGVLDSIRRIQSTKVGPDGTAWAAWSAAYARSGRGRSLMRLSGDLMGSIDHRAIGSDQVALTAETPYAARRQFGFSGTDSRGRKVTNDHARPYLGLSEEAARDVGDIVADHLISTFEAA
jgi:phage virion morphogenesis protein